MAASALNNVIDLNERRALSAAESSRMLNDCRELAMQRLAASLRSMLADIEEELFRMAEASYDREMQNLYLEARGKAKESWSKLEVAFARHFVDVFNQKMRGEMDHALRNLAASAHDLRLVEEDDLAESLALQELASRLREHNRDELSLLGERVALLLGRSELKDEDNPVSPEAVCAALRRACDEIGGSVRIKLVLLKQLERHVADALHAVYADLNSTLVRWNVLPELRTAYRRPRSGAAPAQPGHERPPQAPAAAEAATDPLAACLQQLMQRPQGGSGEGGAVSAPLTSVPCGEAAAPPQPAPLLETLTALQRREAAAGPVPLQQAANILHRLRSAALAEGIGQWEAITIDIVAMLFDFIFDDAKIPDAVKALVGRLQIPVLKVAMLDRTFFSSKSHPARRLLDGIARAALVWGEEADQDDPLFQEIAFIVDRIQRDFECDVQIFADALHLLEAVQAERDALAEALAARSAELIRRREAEEIAWVVAGEAVARRLGPGVPAGVQRFLLEHWQRVLKELLLIHGEEHHAYLSALAMMDDLLWSVTPKTGSDERRQLVNTLPGLLRGLQRGLDLIGLAAEERSRFFDELVALHSAAVKAGLGGAPAVTAETVTAAAMPPPADEKYALQPEGELLITRISQGDVQIEEVALVGAGAPQEDVFLQQVRALVRGDWVEFLQDERPQRARLSWISPQRGLYLFTNPRRPRAMAVAREALAHQFRTGRARRLDEAPLVERAVRGMAERLHVA